MSTPVHEKIKLIRESERLNRKEISELTGIAYGSFCGYEAGDKKPGVEAIMRLLQHPRFTKYTMWFMADQVAPESGQIAPALAHFGQGSEKSQSSDQKTG
ncbi:helix-turn-helix domain-containing protein [Raoultella ornithinolytica]|uniref:helix-turn-helix domain-containing protein n=1 Tax=Raoultella ornithinolytica TaxID=54291 RepID=UPI00224D4316|nr:helix-turn-helix transcriptional regulator [Raoultella ornithinolytica]MCX3408511.1 helix-turn-helix domain-containing protein [Raoultella ornithinolytica]